jgi:hypothetical protein
MFKKQHGGSVLDGVDVVQLLADVVCEEEQECLRAACDRVEEFLSDTGTEIRDIVAIEMLESVPNAGQMSATRGFLNAHVLTSLVASARGKITGSSFVGKTMSLMDSARGIGHLVCLNGIKQQPS